MNEYRVKNILCDIAQKTYNNVPPFKVEIHAEQRKSFHGDYNPNTKVIRIFNILRPTDYIISTTIHELAHHIDFSLNGSSGHNKRFYGILKKLMETAVRCGYVDYEVVRQKTDSRDIMMMEKYFGPIDVKDIKEECNQDVVVIKVLKSYEIKDFLREMGFKYNSIEKTWEKEVSSVEADKIADIIQQKSEKVEIKISGYCDMGGSIPCYIIVSKDTYPHKDELSKHGYKYKGYGININAWVKKTTSDSIAEEQKFLQETGLKYQVKNKLC